MIKIEGHSRMIPGAEAPLNSINQIPFFPQHAAAARPAVPLR
jgi:hypothetical protein